MDPPHNWHRYLHNLTPCAQPGMNALISGIVAKTQRNQHLTANLCGFGYETTAQITFFGFQIRTSYVDQLRDVTCFVLEIYPPKKLKVIFLICVKDNFTKFWWNNVVGIRKIRATTYIMNPFKLQYMQLPLH